MKISITDDAVTHSFQRLQQVSERISDYQNSVVDKLISDRSPKSNVDPTKKCSYLSEALLNLFGVQLQANCGQQQV